MGHGAVHLTTSILSRWSKTLTQLRRCCRWPNRWDTVFQVNFRWQGDPLNIQVSSQLAVDDWEPSACYLPTTRCLSKQQVSVSVCMSGTAILALGLYLEYLGSSWLLVTLAGESFRYQNLGAPWGCFFKRALKSSFKRALPLVRHWPSWYWTAGWTRWTSHPLTQPGPS